MIRIMTDKRLQAITNTAFLRGREDVLKSPDRYIERENEARDKGKFLISTVAFDKSMEDAKANGRFEERINLKRMAEEYRNFLKFKIKEASEEEFTHYLSNETNKIVQKEVTNTYKEALEWFMTIYNKYNRGL